MARPGLNSNRKFLRLARALGSRVLARGVLETIWEPCYEIGDAYRGRPTISRRCANGPARAGR